MSSIGDALNDYLDTIRNVLPRINDETWTHWHTSVFCKIVDGLGQRRVALEKMVTDLNGLNTRMAKHYGSTSAGIDTTEFTAAAQSFGDLEGALRKRLAEAVPQPGGIQFGTPLHLIGRAIERPDSPTWH